jgi:hypothetical protein
MLSWNTTVATSGAETLSTMSYWLRTGDVLAGSSRRLKEATTSSAVISCPSWNFTPRRRRNVHCLRSSLKDQLSARSGSTTRSSRMRARPLKTRLV